MHAHELKLKIADFQGLSRWKLSLLDDKGRLLADHAAVLDEKAPEFEGFLDLSHYLDCHADQERRAESRARLMTGFGDWLATHGLGKVGAALLKKKPATVRVMVPAAAAELVLRPFESARVGGKTLGEAGITLVFQVEGDGTLEKETAVSERLRLLAVFSLPPEGSPLNLREERRALRLLAKNLAGQGRAIELRTLQYGATRQTLKEALEEGDGWDIVHLSGHGSPGRLYLEGEAGGIPAADLAELLAESRHRLKLVTVSACHSGDGALTATLAGLGLTAPADGATKQGNDCGAPVARELVRRLDCAVLAMRFSVDDGYAIALAKQLYHQLFNMHAVLPDAVRRAATEAARAGGADVLSPVTPALFGRRAVGLKLAPPSGAEPEDPVVFEIDEPKRFVGRVGVMTRASRALRDEDCRGVLFHGMSGGGKTACAQELAHHLHPLRLFRGYVWWKAPDQGADISGAMGSLAMALETQLHGLPLPPIGSGEAELEKCLPKLRAFLAANAVLIILDNLESLLWPETGEWRDTLFGRLVTEGLLGHRGVSRTLLTSRVRPRTLPDSVQVEAVHALPLAEAVLLMRGHARLGALMRGDETDRALARQVLLVVQGHPKLIELAEGMAADRALLTAQATQAEAALRAAGGHPLDAFFKQGASPLDAEAFLQSLEGWTIAATAKLPRASRTLFEVLCALEEGDRDSWVLEMVWPKLWTALGHPGPAPALVATLAPLTAAALVEAEVMNEHLTRYRLHPGVAKAGHAAAGPAVGDAVDEWLAGFWLEVLQKGLANEMAGGGPVIRRAALAAAPYLLRRKQWKAAGWALEKLLHRDQSQATLAVVLPHLGAIVAAADDGGKDGLASRGSLANALQMAGRVVEAEALARQTIAAARAGGWFHQASATATGLVNLLRHDGRAEAALALAEEMADYTRRAGLGPWTQLADEGQRLKLLSSLGRGDEVVTAMPELRARMAALPEARGPDEGVEPWDVRETILDAGRWEAVLRGRWQEVLDLNAEILASKQARHASALELARSRANDYPPLLNLKRYDEARALLEECRIVFKRKDQAGDLGKVLSALADLEHRLHGAADARRFQKRALQIIYRADDPDVSAICHNNLATYLIPEYPAEALGHRLAALLLGALMGSGHMRDWLANLARNLAHLGPTAAEVVPRSFAEVVARVEAVEGVKFRELAERLNGGRFDLDQMVTELVEQGFARAAEMPPPSPPAAP